MFKVIIRTLDAHPPTPSFELSPESKRFLPLPFPSFNISGWKQYSSKNCRKITKRGKTYGQL